MTNTYHKLLFVIWCNNLLCLGVAGDWHHS